MRATTERSRSAWDRARSEVMKIKLEAIVQEADLLFSRKGYNATSLDDIASRLHITKTALYHYVQNKNELLYLCYQRSVELTEQCYDQADRQGKSGLDKVLAYLRIDASTELDPARRGANADARRKVGSFLKLADVRCRSHDAARAGMGNTVGNVGFGKHIDAGDRNCT